MMTLYTALVEVVFEPIDDRYGRFVAVLAVLALVALPLATAVALIEFGT